MRLDLGENQPGKARAILGVKSCFIREDRDQRAEIRGQRSEIRGQRSEVGDQTSAYFQRI
jgi:hypothetical protein